MPQKVIKSVLITGIAGSGKSVICSELKNRGYQTYDIEDIDGLFAMVNKRTGKIAEDHDNDDLKSVKQSDWICDKEKLRVLLNECSKGPCFYCGTAANIDDLLPLFDRVFLLIASPEMTRKRLSTRKSKDFGNTPEVQEWVLSWKDWWENHMKEKDAVIINADQKVDVVAENIIQKL